jgi:hypothetical protein
MYRVLQKIKKYIFVFIIIIFQIHGSENRAPVLVNIQQIDNVYKWFPASLDINPRTLWNSMVVRGAGYNNWEKYFSPFAIINLNDGIIKQYGWNNISTKQDDFSDFCFFGDNDKSLLAATGSTIGIYHISNNFTSCKEKISKKMFSLYELETKQKINYNFSTKSEQIAKIAYTYIRNKSEINSYVVAVSNYGSIIKFLIKDNNIDIDGQYLCRADSYRDKVVSIAVDQNYKLLYVSFSSGNIACYDLDQGLLDNASSNIFYKLHDKIDYIDVYKGLFLFGNKSKCGLVWYQNIIKAIEFERTILKNEGDATPLKPYYFIEDTEKQNIVNCFFLDDEKICIEKLEGYFLYRYDKNENNISLLSNKEKSLRSILPHNEPFICVNRQGKDIVCYPQKHTINSFSVLEVGGGEGSGLGNQDNSYGYFTLLKKYSFSPKSFSQTFNLNICYGIISILLVMIVVRGLWSFL